MIEEAAESAAAEIVGDLYGRRSDDAWVGIDDEKREEIVERWAAIIDKHWSDANDELEWLTWFATHAEFGLADEDVHLQMEERYEAETGNRVPEQWGWRG